MQNRLSRFTALIEFDPDLIIEDELNHLSLFLINNKLKIKLNVPILSIVHHLRSDEKINSLVKFITRRIEVLFLKTCDAFIFNSRNTLDRVSTLLKNDFLNYRIIYPGKDNLPLLDRENKNGPVQFLFAGNIIPRKNLDMVINVLEKLSDMNWQFNICGSEFADASYARKIRKRAQNLERMKKIFFRGRVTNECLSEFMAASDMLLAPSDFEGFGITYLEAMRAGVIPVASTEGGTREIIKNGVNGFLISSNNGQELEELLKMILNNSEIIKKMRPELKKSSDSFDTWEVSMNNAVNFIEELLSLYA